MRGVRHPDVAVETAPGQTRLVGDIVEACLELRGDVKREGHLPIEELRLALSKKDFRGWGRPVLAAGSRWAVSW
jgi:hypothetical protein